MKILWTGDIVGSPGRRIYKAVAREIRRDNSASVLVANAENAAAGSGVTEALARELLDAGADVLTLGDHVWNQKGTGQFLAGERRVVRPANLPPGCPGVGVTTVRTPLCPVTVISLLGRVFMQPAECPFRTADAILGSLPPDNGPILVEIHAEATSEKIALGRYLDGRVTAVAGTHTHVPTNDARILPGGTAYITDLGMTGPSDSVIGREPEPVLHKFITGMPRRFEVASGPAVLQGVMIDVDRATCAVKSITPYFRADDGERLLPSRPGPGEPC